MNQVNLHQLFGHPEQKDVEGPYGDGENLNRRWTKRVITEKELLELTEQNPQLSRIAAWEILGRLNVKAPYYIPKDIKKKRPLKVPEDFTAYKNWTPLPITINNLSTLPKFVLVAKDVPFVGWYENGKLVGDAQACIGKKREWTKGGIYKVIEKDIDHISQSYPNAYGRPAAMPLALKVYGNVWIHAGDVVGGYCSHGCINLPWAPAETLFNWAEIGTPVLITESLAQLDNDLKRYARRLKPKTIETNESLPRKRG